MHSAVRFHSACIKHCYFEEQNNNLHEQPVYASLITHQNYRLSYLNGTSTHPEMHFEVRIFACCKCFVIQTTYMRTCSVFFDVF